MHTNECCLQMGHTPPPGTLRSRVDFRSRSLRCKASSALQKEKSVAVQQLSHFANGDVSHAHRFFSALCCSSVLIIFCSYSSMIKSALDGSLLIFCEDAIDWAVKGGCVVAGVEV